MPNFRLILNPVEKLKKDATTKVVNKKVLGKRSKDVYFFPKEYCPTFFSCEFVERF